MKIKEIKDLKNKDLDVLLKLWEQKKLELIENQVKIIASGLKDIKMVKKIKKEIAQILTTIKEKTI